MLLFLNLLGAGLLLLSAGSAPASQADDCGWGLMLFHDTTVRARFTTEAGGAVGWDPVSGTIVNTLDVTGKFEGGYQLEDSFHGEMYWDLGIGSSCSTEWHSLRLDVYGTPVGGEYTLGLELLGPPPWHNNFTHQRKASIQPGGTHRYRLERLPPPLNAVRVVREAAELPRFAAPLGDADPRVFPSGAVIPVALIVDGPVPEGTGAGATLRLSTRKRNGAWMHADPERGGKFGRENRLDYDETSRAYRFDLATGSLEPGVWMLEVTLGDMGPYTVVVEVGER